MAVVYRALVEKLGAASTATFVGNEGELFWDPTSTTVRISDGSTPGGVGIGGGGGGGGSYGDNDVQSLFQAYNFHLLPSLNAQYDIGSAEFKVRHLFLSDNSLWIGDDHKMDSKSGGIKFRKRKNDVVPSTVAAAGGNQAGALEFASVSSLSEITLSQWLAYLTLLDNTKTEVEDLYPAEDAGTYSADDYDSVANETPSHKLATPTTGSHIKDFYLDRGDRVAIHSMFPEFGDGTTLDINIHNAAGLAPYGGTFEVDIWIKSYAGGLAPGGINSLTIDGLNVPFQVVGTFGSNISVYNIKGVQLDETFWKVVVNLS